MKAEMNGHGLVEGLQAVGNVPNLYLHPTDPQKLVRTDNNLNPGEEYATLLATETVFQTLRDDYAVAVVPHARAVIGPALVATVVDKVEGASLDSRSPFSKPLAFEQLSDDQQAALDKLNGKLHVFLADRILAKDGLPSDIYHSSNYVLADGGEAVMVDVDVLLSSEMGVKQEPIMQLDWECFVVSQFLRALRDEYQANPERLAHWRQVGIELLTLSFATNNFVTDRRLIERLADLSLGLAEYDDEEYDELSDELEDLVYCQAVPES